MPSRCRFAWLIHPVMRVVALGLLILCVQLPAAHAEPGSATQKSPLDARLAQQRLFLDQVQPLLVQRCLACHGPDEQKGGLRLDSRSHLLTGGENGPAVVPGQPEQSLLLELISSSDVTRQMPPKEPLSVEQRELLRKWIQDGAAWSLPVLVLFEDDPSLVRDLKNGQGTAGLVTEQPASGTAALRITPLQRDNPQIPRWQFEIRERPQAGQYRYLRWAWKKQGGGSVMIELATSGRWPDASTPQGRFVCGPNTTGWAAVSLGDLAPLDWKTETVDLWQALGDVTLTGIAPTADRGKAAFFDAILLSPDRDSFEQYAPGLGHSLTEVQTELAGDAFRDPRNPIRKLFQGARLDLWSLRKPVRPAVPTIAGETGPRTAKSTDIGPATAGETDPLTWAINPIDQFILSGLRSQNLTPSPTADRRTLIRRVTLDLTGLPPTAEEVDAFMHDADPSAYERLVDRLLDSPAYGERSARLWLDVVRYADTHGYERDEYRPLIWQYRDYVVRAFRQDKPFDQFIREQLAGDELVSQPAADTASADSLIATGYLRLGQWDSTAGIFQEEERLRAEMQADLTNTTAAAFLGLTTSCCQCHDHKYDPLSQADHYRLRAFFAPLQSTDEMIVSPVDELAEIERHNATLDRQLAPLQAERQQRLQPAREKLIAARRDGFPEAIRTLLDRPAEKLTDAEKEQLKPYRAQLEIKDEELLKTLDEPARARVEQLTAEISRLDQQHRQPRKAMGVVEKADAIPVTAILAQGDYASPREPVEPGFPSVLRPGPAAIPAPRSNTTGRRTALAEWIASPENPWTARVIVNRVWQQHFGQGLVATANDFGYSGARPTHPELLDWLACELVSQGWSLKAMHRLILTSATYRQASRHDAARAAIDPDNHGLWRQNVQRMDAETLRDSLLAVSGLLRKVEGGKPRWPDVPEELRKAQPAILEAEKGGDGGRMQGWYPDPPEQVHVRSLYLVHKRSLPVPFLQAFDLPDSTVSCARRGSTVVAPQALQLLNSPEGLEFAAALADRIERNAGPDIDRQIETLLQQVLQRNVTTEERALMRQFLRDHTALHARAADGEQAAAADKRPAAWKALRDLCRAVLNLNEFLYLD